MSRFLKSYYESFQNVMNDNKAEMPYTYEELEKEFFSKTFLGFFYGIGMYKCKIEIIFLLVNYSLYNNT